MLVRLTGYQNTMHVSELVLGGIPLIKHRYQFKTRPQEVLLINVVLNQLSIHVKLQEYKKTTIID